MSLWKIHLGNKNEYSEETYKRGIIGIGSFLEENIAYELIRKGKNSDLKNKKTLYDIKSLDLDFRFIFDIKIGDFVYHYSKFFSSDGYFLLGKIKTDARWLSVTEKGAWDSYFNLVRDIEWKKIKILQLSKTGLKEVMRSKFKSLVRIKNKTWIGVKKETNYLWEDIKGVVLKTKRVRAKNSLEDIFLTSEDPKDIINELIEIDKLMKDVPRIKRLVKNSIRRDGKIIKKLKTYFENKCQFPNCGTRILTKTGWYSEVAHVIPYSKGGESRLGNLLVLFPNHHIEFDKGEKTILEQTTTNLEGILNGKEFEINLQIDNNSVNKTIKN